MKKFVYYLLVLSLSITYTMPLSAEETTASNTKVETSKEESAVFNTTNQKNETVYVNLSHTGKPTEIQVVNSYQMPSTHTIVDYGAYTNITNLTNYVTPTVTEDKIVWNLDPSTNYFYYQGTLDSLELPWTFDIRYQLNGKPATAEELIGASGLIETFIDFTPNENVSDYLKNNFFLQLSTSYDMSKCLSVEAPDGVIVTLGATQSITFMAMPGEETSFYIRVGSDCYESSGFNIVMAPLKMSALEEIANITEAKERVEDSFDAASDSLDIIIDSTDGIKKGVTKLNQSLSSFKTSLLKIREEDSKTDENINKLLRETQALSDTMLELTPHFNEINKLIQALNNTGHALIGDMNKITPFLQATREGIELLQADFINLRNFLKSLNEESFMAQDILNNFHQNLTLIQDDMIKLDEVLLDLEKSLKNSQLSLEDAAESLSDYSITIDRIDTLNTVSAPNVPYMDRFTEEDFVLLQNLQTKVNEVLSLMNNGINSGADHVNSSISSVNDRINSLNKDIDTLSDDVDKGTDQMGDVLYDTSKLMGSTRGTVSVMRLLSSDINTLSESLEDTIEEIETILDLLNEQHESTLFTIDDMSTLMGTISQMTSVADLLLEDMNVMETIIDRFVTETSSLIDTSSKITLTISDTTKAATNLGSGLLDSMTSNRQHLYASIDGLLDSSSYTLQEITYALGQSTNLKENKDIIQDTIHDEWGRLEDDFNLLNYDPDATPVSLISSKNTNVNSVQIILRTPELTIDKDSEIINQEMATEELTVVDRIKNIFVTLFEPIYTPKSEEVDKE